MSTDLINVIKNGETVIFERLMYPRCKAKFVYDSEQLAIKKRLNIIENLPPLTEVSTEWIDELPKYIAGQKILSEFADYVLDYFKRLTSNID